ncbi:MAG: hypothetical protein IKG14_03250 [Clostridia bacterium]|nr:hypothetical protein [Clostridia bacterium]
MFKNKENGFSKIDFILLILIFCAIGIIYYMLSTENSLSEIVQVNIINNILSHDEVSTNTADEKNEQVVTSVALSNDIISQSAAGSNNVPNPTPSAPALNYFFYNQLGEYEKGMYNRILNNISALKSGHDQIEIATSKENVEFDFQACWDAFCLDRPDIFYVDTKKVSFLTKTTSSVWDGVTNNYIIQPRDGQNYYLDCWTTENEINSATSEVESVANDVISKSANYSNIYEKVKYVHDFIIENCEYDQDKGINDSDIYGNLVKKISVCEGYAKAFKYLLDKLNIPCVIVCGDGIADDGHSEFHAWNYVQMDDGNWYAVDATWDDPIVIGRGTLSEKSKHKYFLVGTNNFSDTHHEDGDVSGTGQNFVYPKLSETNYK